MEFSPLLISRFVSGKSLGNTKTDSLDAQSIAKSHDGRVQNLSTITLLVAIYHVSSAFRNFSSALFSIRDTFGNAYCKQKPFKKPPPAHGSET